MAISRFNKRQGIQFNPMDFSTMAAGPLAQQQRYDNTQEDMGVEFDKMATIENTGNELADATVKQHKDNLSAYADKLSKEGYSPGMTDEFMKMKRSYTADINNIASWKQDAAKQNALLDQARLDPSNVIVGNPNLGYESYGTEDFGVNSSVHNQNNYYSRGKDAGAAMSKAMSTGAVDKIPGLAGYLNYVKKPKFETKEDVYGYLSGDGQGMVDGLMQTMSNDPNALQNDQLRASVIEGIASSAIGTQKDQLVTDHLAIQGMKERAAWNKKYSETTPSGPTSIRSMNTITPNQKLFKNANDVISSSNLEDGNLAKSAATNLMEKAFDIASVTGAMSQVVASAKTPTEAYNMLESKSGELRDEYNSLQHTNKEEADKVNAKIKEIDDIQKTVKSNIKTLMKADDNDLNTPIYTISPSVDGYSTKIKNIDTYMGKVGLDKFDFVGGPLAGKQGRKLEKQDEHKSLAENGYEVIGMGAERDSGAFYMIKDSEGTLHTITQRDTDVEFDNQMAEEFGRPELMNIHEYKDHSIIGNEIFKNGQKIDDLEFNVTEVEQDGYRMYEIAGVNNGQFYEPMIKLEAQKLKSDPRIPPYVTSDQLEALAMESLGIPDSRSWWNSPYRTTSKEVIKNYNDTLKAAK